MRANKCATCASLLTNWVLGCTSMFNLTSETAGLKLRHLTKRRVWLLFYLA
jgi:hypothetical protein